MSLFFGRDTVYADLELHRDNAGLVTAATLRKQGGGTVALAYFCLWPGSQRSAQESGGFPATIRKFAFWRTGESDRPKPDDVVEVNGTRYEVQDVDVSLNGDEATGYAKYDGTLVKCIGG